MVEIGATAIHETGAGHPCAIGAGPCQRYAIDGNLGVVVADGPIATSPRERYRLTTGSDLAIVDSSDVNPRSGAP